MDAVLRNDAKYLCASVESAAQRAAQGFCVVCEKMVEGGCGFEHFEMHIQELWNAFQSVEQEVSFDIIYVSCFVLFLFLFF